MHLLSISLLELEFLKMGLFFKINEARKKLDWAEESEGVLNGF